MNNKIKLIKYTFLVYGIPLLILSSLSFTRNLYGVQAFNIILILLLLYCFSIFFRKQDNFEESRINQIKLGLIKIFNYIFKNKIKSDFVIAQNEKISLLFYGVKIFFVPLMLHFTIGNIYILRNLFASQHSFNLNLENINLYYIRIIFYLILIIDTLIFSFGYLVESRGLKNIVKSVESTALGWFVVLVCYPPFNDFTGKILGWYSSDFSDFGNIKLNFLFSILAILLFIIYLFASIALGFKASNLTNRGIVSSGPYKYVRHPAYIAKNLVWWVMGIPFIVKFGIVAIFSLCAWSFIYYLRAVTEEKHLMHDSDYMEYMEKVPYMFIPGLF